MARLYKRGKTWYITFNQAGERFRKRLGKDRKQAEEVKREIEYRLSRNELVVSRRILLSVFKKEFLDYVKSRQSEKTHRNYSIALGHLERYLRDKEGIKSLQDVDTGMIEGYVSFRLKSASPRGKDRTVERSTVNTELKAIKRFFNRAVELNHLRESPARKVRLLTTAKRRPRFFSESEVALILEECGDSWVRKIYLALLYIGLRIGELVNLEWEDVDFERRRIVIRPKQFWRPKGREERFVPMHDVVFHMLLNSERKSRWVFTKADGGKVNVHSLETRFRRQLKRLGLPDASLHTWRHTFASYLMMRSGNIRAVQKLLGHKSIRTTEIYSHLSEHHLHYVVRQLPGPNLGTILDTKAILPGRAMAQVVDNKVVGDTGFEPVTSTV
jgi:site-specific recombinase XerD